MHKVDYYALDDQVHTLEKLENLVPVFALDITVTPQTNKYQDAKAAYVLDRQNPCHAFLIVLSD